MIIRDGVSEQHLGTWSRLTRLHVATHRLPAATTAHESETGHRPEDLAV